jgi:hypothetical protein
MIASQPILAAERRRLELDAQRGCCKCFFTPAEDEVAWASKHQVTAAGNRQSL